MATKTDIESLKVALLKVDRLKKEIAKKRDELRDAVADINDILESLDEAVEDLESGAREFDRAVESMSKFL